MQLKTGDKLMVFKDILISGIFLKDNSVHTES